MLALMKANHPADCMNCDASGRCEFQVGEIPGLAGLQAGRVPKLAGVQVVAVQGCRGFRLPGLQVGRALGWGACSTRAWMEGRFGACLGDGCVGYLHSALQGAGEGGQHTAEGGAVTHKRADGSWKQQPVYPKPRAGCSGGLHPLPSRRRRRCRAGPDLAVQR